MLPGAHTATVFVRSAVVLVAACGVPFDAGHLVASEIPPPVSLAPSLVGAYRKLLELDDVLTEASVRHGVDVGLVRALCLASPRLDLAAAHASTEGCLEAHGQHSARPGSPSLDEGVRQLATLTHQFPRQDYAVAAYYAGAASVGRVQVTDLETLHLVAEAAHFRAVLQLHEPSLRRQAAGLQLAHPVPDDDWTRLAGRLGVEVSHLRFHNPFVARHGLRSSIVLAYRPGDDDPGPVRAHRGWLEYQARVGDTCTALAALMIMPPETIRSLGAWCAGGIPAGLVIRVPQRPEPDYRSVPVRPGETVDALARAHRVDPWLLRRANGLVPNGEPRAGSVIWIPPEHTTVLPPQAETTMYTLVQGDTLSAIAARFGTSVGAIQSANAMGQRTRLRVGEQLVIPPRALPDSGRTGR